MEMNLYQVLQKILKSLYGNKFINIIIRVRLAILKGKRNSLAISQGLIL